MTARNERIIMLKVNSGARRRGANKNKSSGCFSPVLIPLTQHLGTAASKKEAQS